MENREKALLVLMAAAVGYGGYVYFIEKPAKAKAKAEAQQSQGTDLKTLQETVDTIRAQVATYKVPEAQMALLTRAAAAWAAEPLFKGKLPSELAAEKLQGDAEAKAREAAAGAATDAERKRLSELLNWEKEITGKFAYTGYATMENERLAIINGQEYRVGDEPPPGGCVITQIEPDRVVLKRKAGEGTVTLKIIE